MNFAQTNYLKIFKRKTWFAVASVLASLLALVAAGSSNIAWAQSTTGVQLSDLPLFSAAQVPANLLLTLSVEYPTADSIANSAPFNPVNTANPLGTMYVGYFDPALCYSYVYNTKDLSTGNLITTTANGTSPNYFNEDASLGDSGDYFQAAAIANTTTGFCSGSTWSGAFLNWAAMQTIDPFRWALTGGYRSYDGPSTTNPTAMTILKKAWASGDGGSGETQNRTLPLLFPTSSYTPLSWIGLQIRVWGVGTRMQFTQSGSFDNNSGSTETDVPWDGTNTQTTDGTKIYSVKIRVKACDNSKIPSYTLPSWCTLYANGNGTGNAIYKPEGLIQQYSTGSTVNGVYKPPSIRFAAMGYLNDSYLFRDAGVLRAKMEFVGPTAPTATSQTATNANTEWSATSGVYALNPDSADATATNTAAAAALSGGCGSHGTCVTSSGVVNYLNGFGENTKSYKTYDPVDELYYAGIRYFKGTYSSTTNTGAGNVPVWSTLTTVQGGGPNADSLYSMIGGYPVIQTWTDPILYACQKNFILGIGDINAHSGGNVAGSFVGSQGQHNSNNEPAEDPLVSNDVSVATGYSNGGAGAVAATNYIGGIEGLGALGNANVGDNGNLGTCCSDDNTFLMAGLAYDAHVNDMRPADFKTADNLDSNGKKLQIQTLTTYWLDVQEYQAYYYQNEFWLTAKYGGFTVPTATPYVPYVTAFPGTVSWSAAGNNDASQPGPGGGGLGHPMPNNYYGAGNAQSMVSGLTSAFASIAAASSATTTGLAASNYNSVGTAFGSYAVQYDASTWSSDVTAYSTTFSSSGLPLTAKIWDSRTTVSGFPSTTTPVDLGQFSVFKCGTTGNTINGFQRPDGVVVPSGCMTYGTRTIATSTGGAGSGIAFEYASLSSVEQAALFTVPNTLMATLSASATTNATRGKALLAYLRGDQSNEFGVSTGNFGFRARSYLEGDVVNSAVVPIGAPSLSYTQANDPGYPAFVNANANRSTVLYVGANDGMMHAYQGSLTPSTQTATTFVAAGGSEMFSYIPSGTFLGPDGKPTDAGLAALANPNFTHHFYVDATPVVTDVDLSNTYPTVGSSGSWATVLIGGMGKGGQSYYAMNVTAPDTLKTSETLLSQAVLWEFTDLQMGYTVGTPLLVKTASYGWTAVLMSGMNACPYVVGANPNCASSATDQSGGNSFIYLVNPKTGVLYQKITIPAGTTTNPDGASFVTALQNITDGTVDALYFGDLLGQLWRLDLRVACPVGTTNPTCDSTRVGLAYGSPIILAKFTDGTAAKNPQPITTRPTIVIDPNTGNRYISVGTGRLLSSADLTTTQQQTFYTIFDGYATGFLPASTYTTPLTRDNLQSLDGPADSTAVCGVDTLGAGVALGGGQSGYYFDVGPANGTAVSCRFNIPALAGVDGTITFAANIPSGSVCNPSGSNQIFSFQSSTGAPLIVNTNGNNVTVNTAGYTAPGGAVSSLSQFNNSGGITTSATTQAGTNSQLPAAPPTNTNLNRLNWREVPAVD